MGLMCREIMYVMWKFVRYKYVYLVCIIYVLFIIVLYFYVFYWLFGDEFLLKNNVLGILLNFYVCDMVFVFMIIY